MKIEDEISKLTTLNHIAFALIQFIYELEKGGGFVVKTTDWIYEPSKFVAIGFPKRRPEKIRVQFRPPLPHYITKDDQKVLPLYDGRFHHYKCEIKSPVQLAAAVRYIEASCLHPC